MRVDIVDPPAYSPPYDAALAAGLARLGADVRLVTSSFAYGDPPAPDGYRSDERFYRHAVGPPGSRLRALSKRAEHLLDMVRYRRAADADVVHFQWLTVPRLDLRLLPPRPAVLTLHDPLERGRSPLPASAFDRVAAIVVHSEYAREQVVAAHGLEPERVHVIHHGALGATREGFVPPTGQNPSRIPSELRDSGEPVVLCYGLMRPYKGIETLLAAWPPPRPEAEGRAVAGPRPDRIGSAARRPDRVRCSEPEC
jgi:glycosyltransferase involved in cell wall biosynthesis